MVHRHNEEFKREAVRIALTSGLTRRQVASDLGVGFSTLSKWIQHWRNDETRLAVYADLRTMPSGPLLPNIYHNLHAVGSA